MNTLLKILIVSLLISISNFSNCQNVFNSVILSKHDSSLISQAHVINTTLKTGVISNDKGYFTILANKNDSIQISVIGYQTINTIAYKISDTIYLTERNYVLELYNVMPYKTFAEFKEAFVKLQLPDTFKHINQSFRLSNEELVGIDRASQQGLVLTGVVSSIFAAFNKRMKDKANYEMLLLRDEYEAYLATKFNPELVKRITELADTETLNDFINYCDFTQEFIANNNNYTIITQTFECYEEYSNLPLALK